MRKLVFSVVAFCIATVSVPLLSVSCSHADAAEDYGDVYVVGQKSESIYPDSVEKAIDNVYDAACYYLRLDYDRSATDETKIYVIRQADIKDDSGDVIAEVDGYEIAYPYVWPRGYGKY